MTGCAKGQTAMDMTKRVLIAIGIVAIDAVFFFLPISALFLAYILVFDPPWFRRFLAELMGPSNG